MPRTLYTAQDLLHMPDDVELDRGALIQLSPGKRRHGRPCARLVIRIGAFVEAHDLGEVTCNDTGFWLEKNPDTVRGPDVSFMRWERLAQIPTGAGDEEGWIEGPPDLAVEVTANRGSRAEALRRIARFVDAGCPLLWHVYTPDRTVTVYQAGLAPRRMHEGEVLDGGDVLPGFTLEIADIFRAGRSAT